MDRHQVVRFAPRLWKHLLQKFIQTHTGSGKPISSADDAAETTESPPGAGWTPIRADRTVLSTPGYPPFAANRYVIANGNSRQLVLYWYWAHDRAVASEYMAKFYLVADSIRMHRSDGAMIRITTAMFPGESASGGEQHILPFAETVIPLLKNYIPSQQFSPLENVSRLLLGRFIRNSPAYNQPVT